LTRSPRRPWTTRIYSRPSPPASGPRATDGLSSITVRAGSSPTRRPVWRARSQPADLSPRRCVTFEMSARGTPEHLSIGERLGHRLGHEITSRRAPSLGRTANKPISIDLSVVPLRARQDLNLRPLAPEASASGPASAGFPC